MTGQVAQTALAAASRSSRRGPRSPSGWKNSSVSSPAAGAEELPLPVVGQRAGEARDVGHGGSCLESRGQRLRGRRYNRFTSCSSPSRHQWFELCAAAGRAPSCAGGVHPEFVASGRAVRRRAVDGVGAAADRRRRRRPTTPTTPAPRLTVAAVARRRRRRAGDAAHLGPPLRPRPERARRRRAPPLHRRRPRPARGDAPAHPRRASPPAEAARVVLADPAGAARGPGRAARARRPAAPRWPGRPGAAAARRRRGRARARPGRDGPGRRRRVTDDGPRPGASEHGVVRTWDDVLRPVLRAAGARWAATGEGVEVEHLLADCVTGVLREVAGRAQEHAGRRPVLLACAPDELHALPLHALAAGLAERGVASRMLGAAMPAAALRAAVRRTGPAALFLWSQLPGTADPAVLDAAAGHPPADRRRRRRPRLGARTRCPPAVRSRPTSRTAVDLAAAPRLTANCPHVGSPSCRRQPSRTWHRAGRGERAEVVVVEVRSGALPSLDGLLTVGRLAARSLAAGADAGLPAALDLLVTDLGLRSAVLRATAATGRRRPRRRRRRHARRPARPPPPRGPPRAAASSCPCAPATATSPPSPSSAPAPRSCPRCAPSPPSSASPATPRATPAPPTLVRRSRRRGRRRSPTRCTTDRSRTWSSPATPPTPPSAAATPPPPATRCRPRSSPLRRALWLLRPRGAATAASSPRSCALADQLAAGRHHAAAARPRRRRRRRSSVRRRPPRRTGSSRPSPPSPARREPVSRRPAPLPGTTLAPRRSTAARRCPPAGWTARALALGARAHPPPPAGSELAFPSRLEVAP